MEGEHLKHLFFSALPLHGVAELALALTGRLSRPRSSALFQSAVRHLRHPVAAIATVRTEIPTKSRSRGALKVSKSPKVHVCCVSSIVDGHGRIRQPRRKVPASDEALVKLCHRPTFDNFDLCKVPLTKFAIPVNTFDI